MALPGAHVDGIENLLALPIARPGRYAVIVRRAAAAVAVSADPLIPAEAEEPREAESVDEYRYLPLDGENKSSVCCRPRSFGMETSPKIQTSTRRVLLMILRSRAPERTSRSTRGSVRSRLLVFKLRRSESFPSSSKTHLQWLQLSLLLNLVQLLLSFNDPEKCIPILVSFAIEVV